MLHRFTLALAFLLLHGCATTETGSSRPATSPTLAEDSPTLRAPQGPGRYSMTTHTGVTVVAQVPAAPSDPRVAEIERLRKSVDGPPVTYVVCRFDNHIGDYPAFSPRLTLRTADRSYALPSVAARGRQAGLLADLAERGAQGQEVRLLQQAWDDSVRIPVGSRKQALYASLEPVPIDEVTDVLISVEPRGPEFALFKIDR